MFYACGTVKQSAVSLNYLKGYDWSMWRGSADTDHAEQRNKQIYFHLL